MYQNPGGGGPQDQQSQQQFDLMRSVYAAALQQQQNYLGATSQAQGQLTPSSAALFQQQQQQAQQAAQAQQLLSLTQAQQLNQLRAQQVQQAQQAQQTFQPSVDVQAALQQAVPRAALLQQQQQRQQQQAQTSRESHRPNHSHHAHQQKPGHSGHGMKSASSLMNTFGNSPGSLVSAQKMNEEIQRRPSLMSNFIQAQQSSPLIPSSSTMIKPTDPSSSMASLTQGIGAPRQATTGQAAQVNAAAAAVAATVSVEQKKLDDARSDIKVLTDQLTAMEAEIKTNTSKMDAFQKRAERLKTQIEQQENEPEVAENGVDSDDDEQNQEAALVQRIYAENRKRAAEAREKNKFLNIPPMGQVAPLYLEPRDAPGMDQEFERHKVFRPILIQQMVERKRREDACNKYYVEKYKVLWNEWAQKVEKWETSAKKVARDAKHREIFERAFPEIKKAREDKERSGRNERISLRAQENSGEFLSVPNSAEKTSDEQKMFNSVVIPPVLINSDRKEGFFDNSHTILHDIGTKQKKGIEDFLNRWTEEESKLFRSRLQAVGKNFANIAMFFERKSVADCVLYYYLTKKRQNYKSFFSKKRKRITKSYKAPIMPTKEELEMLQLMPQDASRQSQSQHQPEESRCFLCKLVIDPSTNPGRVLTRSAYEIYGIDPKKIGSMNDVKVCTKCKNSVMTMRNTGRCMVKGCASGKRKVKATKPMPNKWRQLDERQRTFIQAHLGVPREIVKCCGPCAKRIGKKLDMLLAGELAAEMEKFERELSDMWQDEEVTRLMGLVAHLGTDWSTVSSQMDGRSPEACRLRYEMSRQGEEEEYDEEVEQETEHAGLDDEAADETMDATDVSVLAASSTVEVDSDPVIGVKMEIDDGKDEVPSPEVELLPPPLPVAPAATASASYAGIGLPTAQSAAASSSTSAPSLLEAMPPYSSAVESSSTSSVMPSSAAAATSATTTVRDHLQQMQQQANAASANALATAIRGSLGSITAGTPLTRPPSVAIIEPTTSTSMASTVAAQQQQQQQQQMQAYRNLLAQQQGMGPSSARATPLPQAQTPIQQQQQMEQEQQAAIIQILRQQVGNDETQLQIVLQACSQNPAILQQLLQAQQQQQQQQQQQRAAATQQQANLSTIQQYQKLIQQHQANQLAAVQGQQQMQMQQLQQIEAQLAHYMRYPEAELAAAVAATTEPVQRLMLETALRQKRTQAAEAQAQQQQQLRAMQAQQAQQAQLREQQVREQQAREQALREQQAAREQQLLRDQQTQQVKEKLTEVNAQLNNATERRNQNEMNIQQYQLALINIDQQFKMQQAILPQAARQQQAQNHSTQLAMYQSAISQLQQQQKDLATMIAQYQQAQHQCMAALQTLQAATSSASVVATSASNISLLGSRASSFSQQPTTSAQAALQQQQQQQLSLATTSAVSLASTVPAQVATSASGSSATGGAPTAAASAGTVTVPVIPKPPFDAKKIIEMSDQQLAQELLRCESDINTIMQRVKHYSDEIQKLQANRNALQQSLSVAFRSNTPQMERNVKEKMKTLDDNARDYQQYTEQLQAKMQEIKQEQSFIQIRRIQGKEVAQGVAITMEREAEASALAAAASASAQAAADPSAASAAAAAAAAATSAAANPLAQIQATIAQLAAANPALKSATPAQLLTFLGIQTSQLSTQQMQQLQQTMQELLVRSPQVGRLQQQAGPSSSPSLQQQQQAQLQLQQQQQAAQAAAQAAAQQQQQQQRTNVIGIRDQGGKSGSSWASLPSSKDSQIAHWIENTSRADAKNPSHYNDLMNKVLREELQPASSSPAAGQQEKMKRKSGYETIADLSSVQGAKVSLPAQTQRRAGTPLGVVSASNAAAAAPTIAASTSTMSSPSFAAALQMRPQMVPPSRSIVAGTAGMPVQANIHQQQVLQQQPPPQQMSPLTISSTPTPTPTIPASSATPQPPPQAPPPLQPSYSAPTIAAMQQQHQQQQMRAMSSMSGHPPLLQTPSHLMMHHQSANALQSQSTLQSQSAQQLSGHHQPMLSRTPQPQPTAGTAVPPKAMTPTPQLLSANLPMQQPLQLASPLAGGGGAASSAASSVAAISPMPGRQMNPMASPRIVTGQPPQQPQQAPAAFVGQQQPNPIAIAAGLPLGATLGSPTSAKQQPVVAMETATSSDAIRWNPPIPMDTTPASTAAAPPTVAEVRAEPSPRTPQTPQRGTTTTPLTSPKGIEKMSPLLNASPISSSAPAPLPQPPTAASSRPTPLPLLSASGSSMTMKTDEESVNALMSMMSPGGMSTNSDAKSSSGAGSVPATALPPPSSTPSSVTLPQTTPTSSSTMPPSMAAFFSMLPPGGANGGGAPTRQLPSFKLPDGSTVSAVSLPPESASATAYEPLSDEDDDTMQSAAGGAQPAAAKPTTDTSSTANRFGSGQIFSILDMDDDGELMPIRTSSMLPIPAPPPPSIFAQEFANTDATSTAAAFEPLSSDEDD